MHVSLLACSSLTCEKCKQTDVFVLYRWFLSKLEYMALLSNDMSQYTLETLPKNMMVLAKKAGFSDKQIAGVWDCAKSCVCMCWCLCVSCELCV